MEDANYKLLFILGYKIFLMGIILFAGLSFSQISEYKWFFGEGLDTPNISQPC
jgi:hypothetical protein